MKAVILAAGEGTRLNKGWTIVPKPLLEIDNITIIEHVITSLRDAGISEFVVVTGFMSEHIKEYLRNGVEHNVSIEYVYNPKFKQNLISSIGLLKEHVQEPFLLCMADLFFEPHVIKDFLLSCNKENNYVFVDAKLARVRRIEEKIKIQSQNSKLIQASLVLPQYNAVDCGIYHLQPSFLEKVSLCLEQGKNSLPLVMSELAIANQFFVYDIGQHEIIDVDRDKDVEYVRERCTH